MFQTNWVIHTYRRTNTHPRTPPEPLHEQREFFPSMFDNPEKRVQSSGLLLNATFDLIWGVANWGAVGKCWWLFDLSSPTALIKKSQLSICKTFLRWTPQKWLRCNLCTVSSLFNREIYPNPDWADFPKARSEGYFLMPFGSGNLANTFLHYSRPCRGWTEQSPGSTAERLTELPAGKV